MQGPTQSTLPTRPGQKPGLEWDWPETYRQSWKVEGGGYQTFYDHWSVDNPVSPFKNMYPYKLSLGMDNYGEALLPFRRESTSGDEILVTKSYNDMFDHLLHLRTHDERTNGVVITGQPGIGKTIFLKFMLVRLISAQQVVLLCDSTAVYLFYGGKVYRGNSFDHLPIPNWECAIWSLIDVDYTDNGPPITGSSDIWPVQTSSPNSIRWRAWKKQRQAQLLGLPLWTVEELMEGVSLQPGYYKFRTELEQSLLLPDSLTHPITSDSAIDAALGVLQTKRERDEVVEAEEQVDHVKMVDNNASATDLGQDETMTESLTLVDNAFKILVSNAIEEFGFIPRDVYNGVLDLPSARREHADALVTLKYSHLQSLAVTFAHSRELDDFSSRVVVVYPLDILGNDSPSNWVIDLKSTRIAKVVVELMRLTEIQHLRETYDLLHKIPQSSRLAEWMFKSIAHRALTFGWESKGPVPPPTPMTPSETDPLAFSTTNLTSSTTVTSPLCVRTRPMTVTSVDFIGELENVTLDKNQYYVPNTTTNPLFDSFTIDHNEKTVAISIFQIAIPKAHGGSTRGYLNIRSVVARVRKLLKEKVSKGVVKVKVTYFLVCPDDGSVHGWRMPGGWNDITTDNDHRGNVFCIYVPVSMVSPRG